MHDTDKGGREQEEEEEGGIGLTTLCRVTIWRELEFGA
jgi:hypothetical protein